MHGIRCSAVPPRRTDCLQQCRQRFADCIQEIRAVSRIAAPQRPALPFPLYARQAVGEQGTQVCKSGATRPQDLLQPTVQIDAAVILSVRARRVFLRDIRPSRRTGRAQERAQGDPMLRKKRPHQATASVNLSARQIIDGIKPPQFPVHIAKRQTAYRIVTALRRRCQHILPEAALRFVLLL